MTRPMSPELEAALSQTHQVPIVMAEFDFDSGTIGMWTGFGMLAWGAKTFFGGGNLVGVSDIKESQDLVANGVVFNLNGVEASNISLALSEPLQNRPCRVYIGIVSVNATLVQEDGGDFLLEDGAQLLLESNLIDDPICVFAGLMDIIEGVVDIPTSSIQLTAENILILLRRANLSRYTHEEQTARYSGDKFFEFTPILQDKEFSW